VERGESREQIAEILDVTVGSLQVRWARLSEQIFRVDKWSVCRG
jgi:hypothetical protein